MGIYMIVWLASYPRSGSTLLRVIIRQIFGGVSYSVYDDPNDIGANAAVSEVVGHVSHGRGMNEFIEEARASSTRYLVKTHEPPPDDSPALYVVRDGRAATVSLWHYWREILCLPMTLEQVAIGDLPSGAWADHVAAWRPLKRPRTVVLRYELLAQADPETIAAVGHALDLKSTGMKPILFEDLNRLDGRFFRTASNQKNIEELSARCSELFWLCNGHAMVALDYASEDPFAGVPSHRRRRLLDEIKLSIKGRAG
jgi:hypothetical protein